MNESNNSEDDTTVINTNKNSIEITANNNSLTNKLNRILDLTPKHHSSLVKMICDFENLKIDKKIQLREAVESNSEMFYFFNSIKSDSLGVYVENLVSINPTLVIDDIVNDSLVEPVRIQTDRKNLRMDLLSFKQSRV